MYAVQEINGAVEGQIELDFITHDTESQAAYAWICNLNCSSITNTSVAFRLGFASTLSQDAGTLPGQVTGGGNEPVNPIIAAFSPGSFPQNFTPGFTYQQGRINATGSMALSAGNDFTNFATPQVSLENSTFLDSITSLGTANRSQLMPDANGQVCVTGLVGCKYFVDTGAANAYVITPANPAISALVDGMDFTVKPAHANTGASTLQVGSTAAFAIKKNGVSTDPVANDILPKYDFEVKWDATDSVWLLTSNPGNGGGGGGSGTVNNSAVALVVGRRWPRVNWLTGLLSFAILAYGWFVTWNAKLVYDPRAYYFHPGSPPAPSLPGTLDWKTSFDQMVLITGLFFAFWVTNHLSARERWRRRFWLVISLTGFSIVVLGLLQRATGAPSIFWRSDLDCGLTFFATYRYHANAGALINIILPFVAAQCICAFRRGSSDFGRRFGSWRSYSCSSAPASIFREPRP